MTINENNKFSNKEDSTINIIIKSNILYVSIYGDNNELLRFSCFTDRDMRHISEKI